MQNSARYEKIKKIACSTKENREADNADFIQSFTGSRNCNGIVETRNKKSKQIR